MPSKANRFKAWAFDSSGHLIGGENGGTNKAQSTLISNKQIPHAPFVPFLIASLGFVGAVVGQITITSDDMPQPDVTYPFVTAAITDMGLGEQTGADVTWDASDLIPLTDAPLTPVNINDASISAALVFNSPFNSTYQCDFFLPTEFPDLGMDLGIPLEGFNNFYQSSGDAYAITGVGLSAMGFDLPITYDDIDEIIPLPLEYGASMTSTGAFPTRTHGNSVLCVGPRTGG